MQTRHGASVQGTPKDKRAKQAELCRAEPRRGIVMLGSALLDLARLGSARLCAALLNKRSDAKGNIVQLSHASGNRGGGQPTTFTYCRLSTAYNVQQARLATKRNAPSSPPLLLLLACRSPALLGTTTARFLARSQHRVFICLFVCLLTMHSMRRL